jgi:hypothetical protein
MRSRTFSNLALLTSTAIFALSAAPQLFFSQSLPGARVVLDAHNCYPYFEWWTDRINRALAAGTPLAIEQDLLWAKNPRTGKLSSLLSHGAPATGSEPGMREYFFEHIRPIIERALREGNHGDWPLITLNLDLKSGSRNISQRSGYYFRNIRTGLPPRLGSQPSNEFEALDLRLVLVLTGESEAQKATFYDQVPGARLLVFGAVQTNTKNPAAPPEVLEPNTADNYHRWWNNTWHVVKPAGQPNAGDWTPDKMARLASLVQYAHTKKLWIRFYTLDGATKADLSCNGWFSSYNFGSKQAVKKRWAAAATAGADYIATDQYEELGPYLKSLQSITLSPLPQAHT